MTNPFPNNLLPPPAGFTGRDAELDALAAQVAEHPVSHLSGPAGVGKTALARALAARLMEGGAYPGGVWHLNLTGAGEESSLNGDLALAVRQPVQGPMVVIWDQMDGVLEAMPDRVQAAFSNLSRDAANRHLVVARAALDGFPGTALAPLAAEGVEALAARADVPAALERAVKGLNDAGRRLLAILSAFPGGATGEALHATFGDEWSDTLADLEKRGLAEAAGGRHQVPGGVIPWLEANAADWRLDVYRDQVAFHLQQMLIECRRQTERGRMPEAVRYLEAEWANLRAAFAWALRRATDDMVDREEHLHMVLDYCTVLFHLFTNRGMFAEGASWMGEGIRAGEAVGDRPQETALLRDYRGVLRIQTRDRTGAREDFSAAREAFSEMGEEHAHAMASYHLGQLAFEEDDLDTAVACFEEALGPMRRVEANRAFAAQASTFLGHAYLKKGEYENAREEFEDAIELYQEGVVSPDLPVAARFGVAQAAFLDGREDDARSGIHQALEALLMLPPRIATGGVTHVVELARVLTSRPQGAALLGETARSLASRVAEYQTKQVRPEFVRDWRITCEIFGRLSTVIGTAVAALEGDGGARERLPQLAAETDGMTGGLLRLADWSGELLKAGG